LLCNSPLLLTFSLGINDLVSKPYKGKYTGRHILDTK
jgi:hypothetical protein